MNPQTDSLREWRRQAAGIVLAAVVVLHLPAIVLFLAGYGPPSATTARVPILSIYLAVVVVAVLPRLPHAFRVWVLLAGLYLIALIGVFLLPQGPWVRALPVAAPVGAIVLIGVPAARIALGISALVLLAAPFLHGITWFGRRLWIDTDAGIPVGHIWVQNIALTAEMVVLMILLERFFGVLVASLSRERRATEERAAAGRRLEAEIEEHHRLQDEIARVGDEERRRLGQEIHDGVCQQLTGALLRCQTLELRLEQGTPPSASELAALSTLLGETIREAHDVAKGLCPLDPTPGALAHALRALAKRIQQASGIACQFSSVGDVLVPDASAAQHLYRVAQEAVSNAVRHARAARIRIELTGVDDEVVLRVEDDGRGVPATLPSGGMGLRTMAFRAQLIHGAFALERAAGGGTRVSCQVPRAVLAGRQQEVAGMHQVQPT
jgi:signal transduction histidine kinase